MLESTKILVAKSAAPAARHPGEACLVHIYPTGPNMGARYPLADVPLLLGRDQDCDIWVNEESVSRRHACIKREGQCFSIMDLQSTNGTFVNDVRVTHHQLRDGDYLHLGNCICRFLAGGNLEAQYHEEIYRLTIIDPLTDIHNRRYLLECLGQELTSAARYRRPLGLVLFDVDKFKDINDRLGHLGGDFVLRELAASIKRTVRREDIFGRYGGEEFAVVMPDTNWERAVNGAERIRQLIEGHSFCYEAHPCQVTISLGVACTGGEEWLTTREIIDLADHHLHQAKHQGRNRTVG